MDWKDIGKKLLNIGVPILGTALGGPVGGIAAKAAISLISAKTGMAEEGITPHSLMAFASDTEGLAKLKEIELNHGLEIERLIIDDRKNAREREVRIVEATGTKDWNLYILAWIVVAGFFGLCFGLMKFALPGGSNEVVFMLFGALSGGFTMVLAYFFGSSRGSDTKTKLMAGK